MAYGNKIDVLLVQPDEIPKVIKISNTLKAKQNLVNGRIQVCYLLKDNEVCLICNDESKIDDSLPNRIIGHDIIYGNFFIVGDDYVNADFKSLTNKQIKKYQELFGEESIRKTSRILNARKLVYDIVHKKY
ncbi:MAG: DUF3846 domain-containing protein [Ignavibacteriales bacterium]